VYGLLPDSGQLMRLDPDVPSARRVQVQGRLKAWGHLLLFDAKALAFNRISDRCQSESAHLARVPKLGIPGLEDGEDRPIILTKHKPTIY